MARPTAGDGTAGRPGEAAVAVADHAVELDCATCVVAGSGCPDCVVTFLLGAPSAVPTVDSGQVRALRVLAGSGLVPPLRHRTARQEMTGT